MPESSASGLPRVLVATSTALPSEFSDEAWLLRELDLVSLVRLTEAPHPTLAVDIDSVEGLNADAAGVRYLTRRLGVAIVMSRRPAVAVQTAGLGAIGLVHVFGFDSTGLRRSLEAIPEGANVGLVVSPGIVLPHLSADERAGLLHPLVAYGLIERAAQAIDLLADADAVVLRPEVALALRTEPVRGAGTVVASRQATSALDSGRDSI